MKVSRNFIRGEFSGKSREWHAVLQISAIEFVHWHQVKVCSNTVNCLRFRKKCFLSKILITRDQSTFSGLSYDNHHGVMLNLTPLQDAGSNILLDSR